MMKTETEKEIKEERKRRERKLTEGARRGHREKKTKGERKMTFQFSPEIK